MSANSQMLSNPGQPMTAAMHYGKTMVLYTAQESVQAVVDGAPPGPNGRLFIVEVGDPTEVPWEAGRFILDHLGYTGVVKVDELDVRNEKGKKVGVEYDVEKAHADSLEAGRVHDEARWARYISDMMDDYVSRKDGKQKAVPQPPAPMLRIMERRGYKLGDYGIKPLGFEDPVAQANQAMKAENDALRKQMADLLNRVNAMEGKDVQTQAEVDNSTGNSGTGGTGRAGRGSSGTGTGSGRKRP